MEDNPMPLEALSCTKCGSSDVLEVKPGTFFCNYCETIFKYVSPNQVAVSYRPDFCSCGNQIQVQCNVCKTGMCWSCDVTTKSYEFVPVKGFGYVRKDAQDTEARIGLNNGKLIAVITDYGAVSRPHLCGSCVADAVPAAAEAIASGEMCRDVSCAFRADRQCVGCGYHFCRRHMYTLFGEGREGPSVKISIEYYTDKVQYWNYNKKYHGREHANTAGELLNPDRHGGYPYTYYYPYRSGDSNLDEARAFWTAYCGACASKAMSDMRSAAMAVVADRFTEILESKGNILGLPEFLLTVRHVNSEEDLGARAHEASMAAESYVREIYHCAREKAVAGIRGYELHPVIVDNRHEEVPSVIRPTRE